MKNCDKCDGKGLTGSGENPLALAGKVITCSDCSGRGKVSEATEEEEIVVIAE